jgi:hypothetical protein
MTQNELIENITWLAEDAGLQMAYPIDHPISKFIMAIEAQATAKEREETNRLRALCEELLSELYVCRASKYLKDTTEAIRTKGLA